MSFHLSSALLLVVFSSVCSTYTRNGWAPMRGHFETNNKHFKPRWPIFSVGKGEVFIDNTGNYTSDNEVSGEVTSPDKMTSEDQGNDTRTTSSYLMVTTQPVTTNISLDSYLSMMAPILSDTSSTNFTLLSYLPVMSQFWSKVDTFNSSSSSFPTVPPVTVNMTTPNTTLIVTTTERSSGWKPIVPLSYSRGPHWKPIVPLTAWMPSTTEEGRTPSPSTLEDTTPSIPVTEPIPSPPIAPETPLSVLVTPAPITTATPAPITTATPLPSTPSSTTLPPTTLPPSSTTNSTSTSEQTSTPSSSTLSLQSSSSSSVNLSLPTSESSKPLTTATVSTSTTSTVISTSATTTTTLTSPLPLESPETSQSLFNNLKRLLRRSSSSTPVPTLSISPTPSSTELSNSGPTRSTPRLLSSTMPSHISRPHSISVDFSSRIPLHTENCTRLFTINKGGELFFSFNLATNILDPCELTFQGPPGEKIALQLTEIRAQRGSRAMEDLRGGCDKDAISVFSHPEGILFMTDQLCDKEQSSSLIVTDTQSPLITLSYGDNTSDARDSNATFNLHVFTYNEAAPTTLHA